MPRGPPRRRAPRSATIARRENARLRAAADIMERHFGPDDIMLMMMLTYDTLGEALRAASNAYNREEYNLMKPIITREWHRLNNTPIHLQPDEE